MTTPAPSEPAQPLSERPQWRALQEHCRQIERRHLRELFAEEPSRGERLVAQSAGLYFDYSKNRITDETIRLLLALAAACGVPERIQAMFRGDKINVTEQRAALHVALRAPANERIVVGGTDVVLPCTLCSTAWPHSPIACGAESGRSYRRSDSQCD